MYSTQLIIDSRIEAPIAGMNPARYTPDTIENANFSTNAFIINENSPSVRNVIGNEKNFNIGFIVTFSNPNTIDSLINAPKENIVIL